LTRWGCLWLQVGEVCPESGKMAKERQRAQNEAAPKCKTDRIKCQKSMVFAKKIASECCWGADGARDSKKGHSLLRERIGLRFSFIDNEKKAYPLNLLCKVMQVSRSGYYHWKRRGPSVRERERAQLIPRVR